MKVLKIIGKVLASLILISLTISGIVFLASLYYQYTHPSLTLVNHQEFEIRKINPGDTTKIQFDHIKVRMINRNDHPDETFADTNMTGNLKFYLNYSSEYTMRAKFDTPDSILLAGEFTLVRLTEAEFYLALYEHVDSAVIDNHTCYIVRSDSVSQSNQYIKNKDLVQVCPDSVIITHHFWQHSSRHHYEVFDEVYTYHRST